MHFNGTDIATVAPYARVDLGISQVPEGRGIFPGMTVLENLEMGKYHRKDRKSEMKEDLEKVYHLFPRLLERVNQAGGTLSGGEQQMVVLARAFAAKPKFLLLDEMSLGLAPVVFLRLIPIIQKIAETGVGVLLVEQFAHLALKIASDSMVITSGRVSYHGPAKELLEDESKLRSAYLG